jgi:hypothetical protein
MNGKKFGKIKVFIKKLTIQSRIFSNKRVLFLYYKILKRLLINLKNIKF